ncbi:hypothetical protein ACJX0J_024660, partial [Zea mays]
ETSLKILGPFVDPVADPKIQFKYGLCAWPSDSDCPYFTSFLRFLNRSLLMPSLSASLFYKEWSRWMTDIVGQFMLAISPGLELAIFIEYITIDAVKLQKHLFFAWSTEHRGARDLEAEGTTRGGGGGGGGGG